MVNAKLVYSLDLWEEDSGRSARWARLNRNLLHFLIIRGVSIDACVKRAWNRAPGRGLCGCRCSASLIARAAFLARAAVKEADPSLRREDPGLKPLAWTAEYRGLKPAATPQGATFKRLNDHLRQITAFKDSGALRGMNCGGCGIRVAFSAGLQPAVCLIFPWTAAMIRRSAESGD